MSIQWMDNYEAYGTGSGALGPSGTARTIQTQGTPYVSWASYPVADPVVSGGVCMGICGMNVNDNYLDNNSALPTPATAVGVAMRVYFPYLGQAQDMIQWQSISNGLYYSLCAGPNGSLNLMTEAGGAGTQIATTTVPVITAGAWWHIEAMVDFALGAITVFVEGVQVLETSISTSSNLIGIIGMSPRWDLNSQVTPYQLVKDFIIYDKNGTVNNTAGAIGPVTVYRLPLISDISNGWTITGGTTVNGTIGGEPPADDTQYISAGYDPIPSAALCGITHLPSNIVGVRGIMTLQRVEKSDGGDASYQTEIVSGSSTHNGATHLPSTTYAYAYDVTELDPATGDLFSPIAVNNADVGITRIT